LPLKGIFGIPTDWSTKSNWIVNLISLAKRTFLLCIITAGIVREPASGQTIYPPPIEWQRSFGGTNDDRLRSLQQTADGGFILGGFSNSDPASGANGNKSSSNFGNYDFWVVRTDAGGNKLWDRSFGGSGEDVLFSLQETTDRGFILGGYSTNRAGGNKTSASFGGYDFWIVRTDANGNKLWDRSYGGANDDYLRTVKQTTDGGFILGGQSLSAPGGNKTSALFGTNDFWVVRIDANGQSLWDRSYGGASADRLQDLQQTRDGGFILGGVSLSGNTTGNKTNVNYGLNDMWLVKIDPDGNILWQRSYGGTGNDELLSLEETTDGGFILGGFSFSAASGNKTSTHYGNASSSDFWVIRTDARGDKIWETSLGGTSDDSLRNLHQTFDRGFIIGGASSSGATGTKTSATFGPPDYWVVRLSASNSPLWQMSFGGTGDDGIWSLQQTLDRGFIFGGGSASPVGGNKTSAYFGNYDYWIVKVATDTPSLRAMSQSSNGLTTNGFHLFLSGITNNTYRTDYSTNALTWRALQTNQLAGRSELEIVDRAATNSPSRIYRASLLP
jgi:hypothetical protein